MSTSPGTSIYVGNLAYSTDEDSLKDAFLPFGEVVSVRIIHDKFSGRSKGFGFVEMSSQEDAQQAITNLNNHDLGGRNIRVNLARPREEGRSFNKRY